MEDIPNSWIHCISLFWFITRYHNIEQSGFNSTRINRYNEPILAWSNRIDSVTICYPGARLFFTPLFKLPKSWLPKRKARKRKLALVGFHHVTWTHLLDRKKKLKEWRGDAGLESSEVLEACEWQPKRPPWIARPRLWNSIFSFHFSQNPTHGYGKVIMMMILWVQRNQQPHYHSI